MVETGTTMILVISTKQCIYSHHENPHYFFIIIILASFERLNLRSTKYKLKYSLDQDCLEIKRNVDDAYNQHSV